MDTDAIHSVVMSASEQAAVIALSERIDLAWAVVMAKHGYISTKKGEAIFTAGENKLLSRRILARNPFGNSVLSAPFDLDCSAIAQCDVLGFMTLLAETGVRDEEVLFGNGRFASIHVDQTGRGRFSFGCNSAFLDYVFRVASMEVVTPSSLVPCAASFADIVASIVREANLDIYNSQTWSVDVRWPQVIQKMLEENTPGLLVANLAMTNSKVVDMIEEDGVAPDVNIGFFAFPGRCEIMVCCGASIGLSYPVARNEEMLKVEIV